MFLEKKLERWVQAGLITETQKNDIVNFEHGGPKSNVMYGVLALGTLSIVTGIISIIAANWYSIPAGVKLGVSLAWLILLGQGIYRNKKENYLQDTLIFLFFGSIIASLALIGQIYHLESHPFRSFSCWLVIGTPIIFFSKSRPIAHVWSLVVVAWVLMGFDIIFDGIGDFEVIRSLGLLPLILIYIWLLLRIFAPHKIALLSAMFKYAALAFVGVTMILGSIRWIDHFETSKALIPSFYGIVLCLPIAFYLYKKVDWQGAVLFVLTMGFLEIPYMFNHTDLSLLGAIYFLILWAGFAYLGVKHQIRSIFEVSCLVISIRIIFVYFEVFGSLLETGLGLIVSGVFILLVAYVWHSRREKIWRMKA